jgi:hypothetical protein
MSLILDGSNGLSDVDGSAATPAIRGTDTNTGIFFPAADTIGFAEGGTEVMRIDGSGNLGIGTNSPAAYDGKLVVFNGNLALTTTTNKLYLYYNSSTNNANLSTANDGSITFVNGTSSPTERMRITSAGQVLFGTSTFGGNGISVTGNAGASQIYFNRISTTGLTYPLDFSNGGVNVGYIAYSNVSTTYSTTSDYRLKENIAPMTGALAKVQALKPVTYNWKIDGSFGQGFIAHELQEVVPDAVVGEKDAVDDEGKPKYQGIDTSFLVATLTAAIQELKTELDTVKAELATLKGAV